MVKEAAAMLSEVIVVSQQLLGSHCCYNVPQQWTSAPLLQHCANNDPGSFGLPASCEKRNRQTYTETWRVSIRCSPLTLLREEHLRT
jgi:hypothetical protein